MALQPAAYTRFASRPDHVRSAISGVVGKGYDSPSSTYRGTETLAILAWIAKTSSRAKAGAAIEIFRYATCQA